jgi:hypothetical protein
MFGASLASASLTEVDFSMAPNIAVRSGPPKQNCTLDHREEICDPFPGLRPVKNDARRATGGYR